MKIVVNNLKKEKSTKEIMDLLFACINDKNISKEDRKFYYSEYLKLSAIYLLESK